MADFLYLNNCHEALNGHEVELRKIICEGRLMTDLPLIKVSLLEG